jgi:hypothetical protein
VAAAVDLRPESDCHVRGVRGAAGLHAADAGRIFRLTALAPYTGGATHSVARTIGSSFNKPQA